MSDVPPVGWIYAMTNPSMPGLTKVGMTTREPEARLLEANTSGTWGPPTPYTLEFAKKVSKPLQKEKALHAVMKKERINPRREFFSISPEEVLKLFDLIDGEMGVENTNNDALYVELDVASGAREVKDTLKKVLDAATKDNKLQVIQRFCSILGLEDLATPRIWTEAEWQDLIPAFNELWDPADPESLTVSDHARVVFGVREHRLVEEDERKVDTTPSRLLLLEVDSVLRRWSGTSIKRTWVGDAKVRTPSKGGGESLKADFQTFLKTKMKELEADFPEAQSRQKEVGRLWALEKEAKGVSPAKTVNVYEYRMEPALEGKGGDSGKDGGGKKEPVKKDAKSVQTNSLFGMWGAKKPVQTNILSGMWKKPASSPAAASTEPALKVDTAPAEVYRGCLVRYLNNKESCPN